MATEDTTADTTNTDAAVTTDATTNQTTDATTETNVSATDALTTDTDGKDAAAETQPTEVEYNFTLPDGFTANEELTGDLKSFAKDNKLSPEAAQKIADLGIKMQQQQAADYQKQVDSWGEQVKADPLIGGDNYNENVGLARQALASYGDKELSELLESTGFGNHPAIVRAFYKIGKSVSNDTLVVSNGTTAGDVKSAANVLFPTMK